MPEAFRLYLDQMIQKYVAEVLSRDGYDVVRASEVGQARADDRAILEKAVSERRALVTLDDHFGDWAVLPLDRHAGVIRLKVNPTTAKNILNLLRPFLQRTSSDEIVNHLVILSSNKEKWILTSQD
jgi:predicted nuclease of predicted toxin-antitoxin system